MHITKKVKNFEIDPIFAKKKLLKKTDGGGHIMPPPPLTLNRVNGHLQDFTDQLNL